LHGTFDDLPLAQRMKATNAPPHCGLLILDLRNGDIVQWFTLRGDVTELYDVAVIPNIRCSRGIGPNAPGLEEMMRGGGAGFIVEKQKWMMRFISGDDVRRTLVSA
jgi:Domain of unknown function (DUF4915)